MIRLGENYKFILFFMRGDWTNAVWWWNQSKARLVDARLNSMKWTWWEKQEPSVWQEVSKVSSWVNTALNTVYDVSSEKKNKPLEEILRTYSFVSISDNSVKIDLSKIPKEQQSKLNQIVSNFLRELLSNGFTIRGISRDENIKILNTLYEKVFKSTDIIFLWDSIIPVEDYYLLEIWENLQEASFVFTRWHILDKDKFIASLYNSKVYYWYDIENISKWFEFAAGLIQLENSKLVIAKWKSPTNWTDAKLEIVSSKVQLNQRAKWSNEDSFDMSKKINFFDFINTTFDVKAWEKLFKKNDATKWTKWKNIRWESIWNIEWTDDINLDELWEWLYIKEEEWIKYIVAKIDWKFNTNVSDITKITPKDISVTEWVIISWDVDNNKWDITFKKWDSVTIKWNILDWRKISWNPDKLIIEWDVEWIINVSANTEIIIQWSMKWSSMLVHKWTWIIYVSWVISNNAIIDAKKSDITIETIEWWTIYAKDLNIHKLIKANIVSKNLKVDELTNNIEQRKDWSDEVKYTRLKWANVTIISETIDIVKFDSEDTTIKFIISWRDANIKTWNNILELKSKLEDTYNDTKKYLNDLDLKYNNKLKYEVEKDIISEILRIKNIFQQTLNSILDKLKLIQTWKASKEILDKKLTIIKQGQDFKSIILWLDERKRDIEFIIDEISNLESKSNDNNFLQISEICWDSFGEVYKYNYTSQASIYDLLYEIDREELVESKSKEYKDILKEIFDEINKMLKSIYPEIKTKFCRDTNVRFWNRNFKWTPENLKTKKEA